MALVSLSAMCHTVTSAFSCVGGGVVTQKAAMGFTKTRPLLRPGRRLCVVVTQTRAASAGTDTDNRKARKAGKQSANALAVHKRLKADDSYFWKLKGESFSRERMDRKTATELFGEDKSGPGSEFPSSSFEIESDTPVTRSGEVGKDVRAIDEFGEDFRNVVPEWTFDNLTKKDRMRYRKPSPIQRHCVPLALAGHDVLASAQTGSGKTVAFLLPLIASIVRQGGDARNTFGAISDSSRDPARPKALVLAPTRELALQIENEIEKLTFGVPVAENSVNNRWSAAVYGGSSARPQLQALAAGVEIIVATPGRLVDFLTRSPPMLSLSSCQFLVLDEADRMLDMGFEPSLRKIVEGSDLPRREKRQTLLFSATFPQELQNVARKSYLKPKFVSVAVGKVGKSNSAVEQRVVRVVGTGTKQDKFTTLVEIMEPSKTNVDEKTIIFVNKKRNAAWLAKMLQSSFDIKCAQVHGDRSQPQRELALAQFRSNETKILVATDAVARGIDVSDVTHVIQFDLPISPKEFESYTHRIGRTGRAGKSGLATAIYVPGFEKGIGNEDVAHLLVNSLTENGAATPDWLPAPKATGRRGGNAGQNNERTRNSSFDQRMEERAIRAGEGGQFDENFSRQRRPSEAPRAGGRGGGVYRGEFDDEFSRGARGAGRGGGRGGPIRGGYISTGARGSGRGGCGGARDDEEDVRGPGRGGYGGARGRGGGRGSRDAGRGSGVNRGRGGY